MTLCSQQFQYTMERIDEDFDEWADQLEALCEISHQNICHEMMGRSSAAVKKIIRSH